MIEGNLGVALTNIDIKVNSVKYQTNNQDASFKIISKEGEVAISATNGVTNRYFCRDI